MTTDADRIIAAGRTILLTDGTQVPVRFGMRGLGLLEEAFGSLTGIETVLNSAMDEDGNVVGHIVNPVNAIILAGTLKWRRKNGWVDDDDFLEEVSPADLEKNTGLLMEALMEAMPAGSGNPPGPVSNGSTGPSSTTPEPSASEGAMTSSGT